MRSTWLRAVYFIRHKDAIWGSIGQEKVMFRPRRVEVEIVIDDFTLIRIWGIRVGTKQQGAEVVYDDRVGLLRKAPPWAREYVNEAKKLLIGDP